MFNFSEIQQLNKKLKCVFCEDYYVRTAFTAQSEIESIYSDEKELKPYLNLMNKYYLDQQNNATQHIKIAAAALLISEKINPTDLAFDTIERNGTLERIVVNRYADIPMSELKTELLDNSYTLYKEYRSKPTFDEKDFIRENTKQYHAHCKKVIREVFTDFLTSKLKTVSYYAKFVLYIIKLILLFLK